MRIPAIVRQKQTNTLPLSLKTMDACLLNGAENTIQIDNEDINNDV